MKLYLRSTAAITADLLLVAAAAAGAVAGLLRSASTTIAGAAR